MGIFSLTVTTDGKTPVKNDDLENKDSRKEEGLEKWQLNLIIGAVTFSIFLITIVVVCKVNCDSKKRAMAYISGNHGGRNQLQLDNFDNVIENRYA